MTVKPLLEAREAALHYRGPRGTVAAVRSVTCEVWPGQLWAVTGPSGHGKSSLLYLLSGLRLPSAGRVAIAGREYRRLGAGHLADIRRTSFGFVFQEPFWIPYLTSLENVLVAAAPFSAARGVAGANGGAEAVRARGEELLARLGVAEVADRYPNQLSGGQRQRVSLARALVGQPAVLFADEPTAALDAASAGAVTAVLDAYRREGGTVVVATHDPVLLRKADEVRVMEEGVLRRGGLPGA